MIRNISVVGAGYPLSALIGFIELFMSLSSMCSSYQSSTVRYWLSLGLSARVEGTRAVATSRRIWDFMLGFRSSLVLMLKLKLVLMLNLEFSLNVKVDGSGRKKSADVCCGFSKWD